MTQVTEPQTVGGYFKPIAQAPLGGNDTITMDQARIVALAYALGGVILGSVGARKRAEKGAEPFAKVFF